MSWIILRMKPALFRFVAMEKQHFPSFSMPYLLRISGFSLTSAW
jgi:hypothetical protein